MRRALLISFFLCMFASFANSQSKISESDEDETRLVRTILNRSYIKILGLSALDWKSVKICIEKNGDIETQDSFGNTVLQVAVRDNNYHMVEWLIKKGADINAFGNELTILETAAKSGNLKITNLLIANGAYVNDNQYGINALGVALNNKNYAVAKLLILHDAFVNIVSDAGGLLEYPVQIAAEYNNFAMLKLLSEKGANLRVLTENGESLVDITTSKRIKEYLQSKGITPNKNGYDEELPVKPKIPVTPNEKLIAEIDQGSNSRCNWDSIKQYIKEGADINSRTRWNYTVLHLAISCKRFDFAEMLISKGAEINTLSNNLQTPLGAAIFTGNIKIVKLLLDKGADVNFQTFSKCVALHSAAKISVEMCSLLVAYGAQINTRDANGKTPIFYASADCNSEIIDFFLSKGADINTKDKEGKTILYYAVESNHYEIIQELIAKGADPNETDNKGISPYTLAIMGGYFKNADILRKSGGNLTGRLSESYIKSIILSPNDTAMIYILNHGYDINSRYKNGRTLLQLAILFNRKKLINYLLNNGALVNAKDGMGETALWLPYMDSSVQKLLIKKGADINIADNEGNRLLNITIKRRNHWLAYYLIKRGTDINTKDKNGTPLQIAAFNEDSSMVHMLLRNGARIPTADSDSWTAMYIALINGQTEDAQIIADKIKDINCRSFDNNTLLHAACMYNRKDIALILIKHGAKVSAINSWKATPIELAVQHGDCELLNALVDNGAKVNIKTSDGTGLLNKFMYNQYCVCIVSILLKHGASPNELDENGRTPLDYTEHYPDVKNLLESYGGKYSKDLLIVKWRNKVKSIKDKFKEPERQLMY